MSGFDENRALELVGVVVREALKDFMVSNKEIEKETNTRERNRMIRDRSSARIFFKKSTIFEATGLSLEYLIKRYKKIKKLERMGLNNYEIRNFLWDKAKRN